MNFKCCMLFFCLFSVFTSFGQNNIDLIALPDVEDYTVVRTNPNADTVILAFHGGPTGSLIDYSFDYLRDIPTFSVIDVKKQEMLRPVWNDTTLTLDEATAINDTTVALIEKAIQFYKNKGKVVVLIGHSWGALTLAEYMDDYGVNNVHRIIAMEGRLSIQQEYVDYLMNGYLLKFQPDGYTLIVGHAQPYVYPHGILTLVTAGFQNRWIDSLSHLNLTNVMYAYAEFDINVGTLLPEEVDFLNERGARILFSSGKGHGASNSDEKQQLVVEFIRENINKTTIEQGNLRAFPTVALDWIQIESEQTGMLEIYNFAGQLVLKKIFSASPTQLDVSNLSVGQYVIVLRNSSFVSTARFQVFR